ncbi:MAG: O-methyltransferase [Anaplasma sp.]
MRSGACKMVPQEKESEYVRRLFGVDDRDVLGVRASAPDVWRTAQLNEAAGQLLQLLIKASGTKSIVEVGTCVGFSTICMAKAMSHEGRIYTIERNSDSASIAECNIHKCGVGDRITVLVGNATERLRDLENMAPFDMMFIDADKISYCDYLNWAERNIRTGGLIVADNVFLSSTVFEDTPTPGISRSAHKSMQSFNLRLADKNNFLSSVFPIEDGVSVAVKLA